MLLIEDLVPRPLFIPSDKFPYHITGRANNREWFYVSISEAWRHFSHGLLTISNTFEFGIHSFVLMSNHFHLIGSTPNGDLDRIMKYFMRETAKSINRTADRINHLFGAPYSRTLITSAYYYRHAMKYVYRNPVKAGLCGRVEDYPYSSLHYWNKGKQTPFPVKSSCFDEALFHDYPLPGHLAWLNLPYEPSEHDCVRKALRKRQFRLVPDPKTRKIPPGLTQR